MHWNYTLEQGAHGLETLHCIRIHNHRYQKLLQVFVLHPCLLLPANCHELLAVTSYRRGGCQSGFTTRANIAAHQLYGGEGILGILHVDLLGLFILTLLVLFILSLHYFLLEITVQILRYQKAEKDNIKTFFTIFTY